MHERLTEDELAALPSKARRDPAVVSLYRTHDYLTAYALHTDRRVRAEGHQAAAGADASRDNWNSHGELQRDFLVMHGLRPWHRLLDFGCGAGRLARHVVRYLEPGRYHGVDLSHEALDAAIRLSVAEGWSKYEPRFWWRQVGAPVKFEVVWAHSVVTHLPPEMIEQVMREIAALMAIDAVFYWSYLPTEETARYGLTQFRTTREVYAQCAERAGLTFEDVPNWVQTAGHVPGRWSYGQSMARSRVA